MEYYSAIKTNEVVPVAAMDGPRDYHSKWSKPDRERQILYDIDYCGIQKNDAMNLFTKQKQTHRHRKQTDGYQRGKEGIN